MSNNPECERDGCPYPADEVDHIVPQSEAPHRRYDYSNLMSLCEPHHEEKTKQDTLRGRGLGESS